MLDGLYMTEQPERTVRRFPSVQNRVLISACRGGHRPDEGLQLLYCPLPRPIARTEHSSKARSSRKAYRTCARSRLYVVGRPKGIFRIFSGTFPRLGRGLGRASSSRHSSHWLDVGTQRCKTYSRVYEMSY